MIRAVFFDVDGTLLSHTQKAVPADARRALDRLAEKGILRVIATGRHMLELAALPVRDIRFDGYITLNGQLCLDGGGNVVSGAPIVGEELERIVQLFREKTVPLVLVEQDAMYINFVNGQVEAAQRAISTRVPRLGAYTGRQIYQAVAYLDREREHVVRERLPRCKLTRWNEYGVDIMSRQGGKAAGIREYLALHGIGREETMAFGDGENDMEMLRFVGIGVAMGNADPSVKEAAGFVTASVDGGGIEKALVELKVLDPLPEP